MNVFYFIRQNKRGLLRYTRCSWQASTVFNRRLSGRTDLLVQIKAEFFQHLFFDYLAAVIHVCLFGSGCLTLHPVSFYRSTVMPSPTPVHNLNALCTGTCKSVSGCVFRVSMQRTIDKAAYNCHSNRMQLVVLKSSFSRIRHYDYVCHKLRMALFCDRYLLVSYAWIYGKDRKLFV